MGLVSRYMLNIKQKMLNSVQSKIYRLNRYYNSPSELLARAFEMYIFENEYVKENAPLIYNYFNNIQNDNALLILSNFIKILK